MAPDCWKQLRGFFLPVFLSFYTEAQLIAQASGPCRPRPWGLCSLLSLRQAIKIDNGMLPLHKPICL